MSDPNDTPPAGPVGPMGFGPPVQEPQPWPLPKDQPEPLAFGETSATETTKEIERQRKLDDESFRARIPKSLPLGQPEPPPPAEPETQP
jgi:hypothetical protein